MGAVFFVFDLTITGFARLECWNGVKLQWPAMQQQQHGGHSENSRRAFPHLPHARSPSDLLIVHTVCGTHTVSVTDR